MNWTGSLDPSHAKGARGTGGLGEEEPGRVE